MAQPTLQQEWYHGLAVLGVLWKAIFVPQMMLPAPRPYVADGEEGKGCSR